MTDKYTQDNTVIADAENFCIGELRANREPKFSVEAVGAFATWRQRRLFESAMLRYVTKDDPGATETHRQACELVERFRFENYGEV